MPAPSTDKAALQEQLYTQIISDVSPKIKEAVTTEITKELKTQGVDEAGVASILAQLEELKGFKQKIELQGVNPGAPSNGPPMEERAKLLKTLEPTKALRTANNSFAAAPMINVEYSALLKTVTTTDWPTNITYRPRMVEYKRKPIGVINRIPKISISGNEYGFYTEEPIGADAAQRMQLDAAIVGGAGATATFKDVTGLFVGTYCRFELQDGSGNYSGTTARYQVQSINTGTKVVTFTANIAESINNETYVAVSVFGCTPEGLAKPFSQVKRKFTSKTLKTHSVLEKVTEQQLASENNFLAFMQRDLQIKAERSANWLLLYGDDSERQFDGLLNKTGRLTYAWSSGEAGDTMADAIMKAANVMPDASGAEVVINREDWTRINLEKNKDGSYVQGSGNPIVIMNTMTQKSIGPYPVIIDDMMDTGEFMLINFSETSELVVNPSMPRFKVGTDQDDFSTNRQTLRYDEYAEHCILSLQSYVHGSFDSKPEIINTIQTIDITPP